MLDQDSVFNKMFSLKDLRQWDLLIMTTSELKLDGAQELKAKIKTMADLKKLLDRDDVALALVHDGVRTAAKTKDVQANVLI